MLNLISVLKPFLEQKKIINMQQRYRSDFLHHTFAKYYGF